MPEGSELPRKRRIAGLTGTVAAGLAVLAVFVLAAQVWAWVNGYAGPGVALVVGHVVAAGIALLAQRVVDTEAGRRAGICAGVVAVVAVADLLIFWWL